MRDFLKNLNDGEYEALLKRAREVTYRRFGRVIQLYAPLYLSNECIDTCTYCGFSHENRIPRRTLMLQEVEAEADFLIKEGFRHLLLVSGEHPSHVSVNYLEEVIRRLKPQFASLSVEVAPLRENDYRRLILAGLDGVVIYQETYDPGRYAAVHVAGPKKNFERRIEAPKEAARAGVRLIGMGFLLGLADWRSEAVRLIEHIQVLRKKHWQVEFTISLPRLRPSASGYKPPCPISDRDFVQLIAALRITLPEIGIILSTRESPTLRDQLIGLGVTQMSAGSRTEPGGYLHPEENLEQFEIEDRRSAGEVAEIIRVHGYEPVWKDL